MKKLVVNQDACISCGACISIDSDHFDWDENGQSHAISQENLDATGVTNAIESCPTGAISLEEDDECHCENCNCEKKDSDEE